MKKVFLIIILLFFNSCSKPNQFTSTVANFSKSGYGIIITKITQHDQANTPANTLVDSIYIAPSIPDLDNYGISLSESKQIPKSELPNYLTFEYHYVRLSDCQNEYKERVVKLFFDKDHIPIEKGSIRAVSKKTADYYLNRTKGIVTLASIANKKVNKDQLLKQYIKELEVAETYWEKSNCELKRPVDSLKFVTTIDLRPYKQSEEIKKFRKRNKSVAGSYYGTRINYQFYDYGKIKLDLSNYGTNPWK